MEGEASRVIGTEVGRVGFHCVEISYARTTCKTETGNVEKILMGNCITDINMQGYAGASIRVVDRRIGKRLSYGINDGCIRPMAVRISGSTITSWGRTVHKVDLKKYVFPVWTCPFTWIRSISVTV